MQRREFLRNGLALGATASLSGAGLTAQDWISPISTTEPLLPIGEAVVGGHWHIVKEWLRRDPALIAVTRGATLGGKNWKNLTLLHLASALSSDVEMLKYLIAQGANVNAVAREMSRKVLVLNFDPAAAVAEFDAESYHEKRLQWMISRGASVSEMAWRGWETPPFLAARYNPSVEFLQYLISVSAEINPKFLLEFAAPSNSNAAILEYLVSQCDGIPRDILGSAAKNPNVAIMEYLVSQGADVNGDCALGGCGLDGLFWSTPLYFAAAGNSNVDVLKYLIAHGADVNVAATMDGNFCCTPLHAAASVNPNVEVMKCLIAHGANVHATDGEGKTPMDIADTEEKKHILRAAMISNRNGYGI